MIELEYDDALQCANCGDYVGDYDNPYRLCNSCREREDEIEQTFDEGGYWYDYAAPSDASDIRFYWCNHCLTSVEVDDNGHCLDCRNLI